MPGGDRTGPFGQGPRTGRIAGFCGGYDAPGYANPGYGFGAHGGYGRGTGFGRGGGGRGWRNRFFASGVPGRLRGRFGFAPESDPAYGVADSGMAARDELKMLRSDARRYEDSLREIRNRIDELEKRSTIREE